jgi:hypothetical protein
MKKFEYKEPEFMIVQANTEDVLTTSPIETVSSAWDTGVGGRNGGMTFGI